MPATLLPTTTPENAWSTTGVVLVMTALDNANGNYFIACRDSVVFAQNTDASPHTLTITSTPLQPSGRVDDISQAIEAGEIRVFRICKNGWQDADGMIQMPAGQSALLKLGIVDISS